MEATTSPSYGGLHPHHHHYDEEALTLASSSSSSSSWTLPIQHHHHRHCDRQQPLSEGTHDRTTTSARRERGGEGGRKKRARGVVPRRLTWCSFLGAMVLGLGLSQWLLGRPTISTPEQIGRRVLQQHQRSSTIGAGRDRASAAAAPPPPLEIEYEDIYVSESEWCSRVRESRQWVLAAQAERDEARWKDHCQLELNLERKRLELQLLQQQRKEEEEQQARAKDRRRRLKECRAQLARLGWDGGGGGGGDLRARLLGPSSSGVQSLHLVDTAEAVQQLFSGMADFPYFPTSLLLTTTGGPELPASGSTVLGLSDLQACGTLETVILGNGRCYLALPTQAHHPSRWLHKFAFDHHHHHRQQQQQRQQQPPPPPEEAPDLKAAERRDDDDDGSKAAETDRALSLSSSWSSSLLSSWYRVTRIPHEGKTPPTRFNARKHEERFLSVLLSHLPSLEEEAKRLIPPVADKDTNLVVAMAVTQGDLDTLANLACSLRKHGLQGAMANTMVFAGDEVVVRAAKALGFHSMTHPAFNGNLPKQHAVHYGDEPFLDVMWLKSVSAWLVNRLGYHVLFQDADIVWFKDPRPALLSVSADSAYMDDGARSERFGPYFMNSGFFFFRKNDRTTHLLQSLLFSHDMVIQWASHQTTFVQAIELGHLHHALSFKLMQRDDFPGGRMYHHEKEKLSQVMAHELHPYIFHMNWCQFKTEKVSYFTEANMWYVQDTCTGQESSGGLPPSDSPLLVLPQQPTTGSRLLDACCKPLSYGV